MAASRVIIDGLVWDTMTSILTNVSAMSAVSALAATQRSLATTENQITTGLRVSSAKDNAAYWSIATSMKTRIGEMQAVNDGLDLTSGILSTTATGLTQVLKLMQGIAQDLVTTQTTGADLSKIQTDIAAKQQGIISAAKDATYNGVNWLVTRVVGTSTQTLLSVSDTTRADEYGITGRTLAGTVNTADTTTSTNTITETLGSTSSSTNVHSQTNFFVVTSTANPSPATGFDLDVSYPTPVVTDATTGDTTSYLKASIPISVDASGVPISNQVDLSRLQLFKSFSGSTSASSTIRWTDATDHQSSSQVLQQSMAPYLDAGQTDVISGNLSSTGIYGTFAPDVNDPLAFDVTSYSTDIFRVSQNVTSAIAGITQAAAVVGSLQNEVDGSKLLNTAIIDALTSGVGSLVDADMNEASTRLNALQTQQQLGTQALSVANDNSQIILKLFGG